MADALFAALLASVREMGAVRRGECAPTRAWDVAPDGTRMPRCPDLGVDAPGGAGDTRGDGA